MKKTINCFLGACLLLQIGPARAQQNPDGTNTNASSEVPFELRGGFLVVFEGRIGQLHNLKFVLDTGTTLSVVDRKVAQRLSSRRRAGRVFSFDKYISVERADFPVMQFGPIEVHNVSLMVADLRNSWGFPGHADAFIGLDLLRQCKGFLIDYTTRMLVFHATSTSNVPLAQAPAVLTMRVLVQGQPVRLLVDTGMDGILLYEDRLRKRLPNVRLEDQKDGIRFGYLRVKQARLPGVVLSGPELEPTVSMMKGPSESLLSGVDGYVGVAALNARQVEFNFETNSLAWN
jgi:hypothetical protein